MILGQLTQLVECYLHMVEAEGSSPPLPTTDYNSKQDEEKESLLISRAFIIFYNLCHTVIVSLNV